MSEISAGENPASSILPNAPGTPSKKLQENVEPEYEAPPSPTSTLDPQDNEWKFNITEMPTPMSGHTATCIDQDRIIIVGGLNHENRRLKSVNLFTTENKYIQLFDLSTERSSHGAAYFEHQSVDKAYNSDKDNSENNENNSEVQNLKYLYIFGGFNRNGKPLKSVERMNTKTYRWEKATDMTQPRSRFATTVCKNHIYILGGYSKKSTYLSSVERYDPVGDTWEAMPPMKQKRIYHAAVTVGERIYVLGGGEDASISGILKSVEVFDTAAKSWSRGPDMPMKLSGMSAVAVGKWILVIGGLNKKGEVLSQAFILNTETLKWYSLETPKMSEGRSTHAIVLQKSKIYAFGGQGGVKHTKLDSVEEIMFHDLMMVVLDLHSTNESRMKGFKRQLKRFKPNERNIRKENEKDPGSTGKDYDELNNNYSDYTSNSLETNLSAPKCSLGNKSKSDDQEYDEQKPEEDDQSRGLSSTGSSKSDSAKSNSKMSTDLGSNNNVIRKITSFRSKDVSSTDGDSSDENLSIFSDPLNEDDGSFCSSIAISHHNSMIATKKMEENIITMKSEYVDLEKKVGEQNKTIDELLKQHRSSEMETLILEQRKIIQDLVRREPIGSINDDLLLCNNKIAKMEKLSDGHRLIFNNFRRQQQRTNHITSFKVEEIEKALKDNKDLVQNMITSRFKKDDEKDSKESKDDLILQLKNTVDNLKEQLNKQNASHHTEIEEMKQKHKDKVNKLENTLDKLQKSYDQKFAKIFGAMHHMEHISDGLKKEVAILRIEKQFMNDD